MRLLVANFFPAHVPPRSGGEQRYYHLYRHLSAWHDVTLLSANFSDKPVEYVEHSPSFREYRVPKPPQSDALHWKLFQAGIGDDCSGYVVALCGGVESVFRTRFRELIQYADAVVHECPFTFPYDETAGLDGKPRVYASYNVEHRLAAQIMKGRAGSAATRFIRFLEGRLIEQAELVTATSAEEADVFAADFPVARSRIDVVANGFEPWTGETAHADAKGEPFVVFLGSAHPPNVEAGRFICGTLAPAVPGLAFHVLGAVCSRLEGGVVPPNVRLLGFVSEEEMRAQLRGCAAALNPLFSGAGTNLKMLQYMEAGAAIVTTPIGARGLDLEDGVDAVVCEADAFAARLQALGDDPARLREIGRAAHAKAHARYTWRHIAEAYSSALGRLPLTVSRGARPRLLHINDYPVLDRVAGGQIRIYELLTQLSRDFEVQLVTLTDGERAVEARMSESAWMRSIPKTVEHRQAERQADARAPVSVRDVVAADWAPRNEAFVAAVRAALPHVGAIVFEHPYLASLLELVPAHIPVIYSSQNVEEDLKAQLLAQRADGEAWIARVRALERRLCERADAIVAVCEEDARRFRERYPGKTVLLVENGMPEPSGFAVPPHEAAAQVVFVGSAHMPNVVAGRFIVERLAPALPAMTFHVIGSVGQALALLSVPPNVVLHGVLDETAKQALVAQCGIAINPMASGGGSSLKVPDLLSAGLPLVSTALGARGFGLRPGIDYLEASLDDFAARLQELAADGMQRQRLGQSGRHAVARVAWPVLGSRYRRLMRSLVRRERASGCRILVATYRLMEPAPGGAESYLNNLLAHLGTLPGVQVDVAACDVSFIRDHWHFSAIYGAPGAARGTPRGVTEVHRFAIDPPAPDAFAKCRTLHTAWMRESCLQWLGLFVHVDEPMLLGGWNFPERSGDVVWRWTSLHAQVGVPRGFDAIRIEGTSHGERHLAIACGTESAQADVSGPFALELPLHGMRGIVELRVDQALLPDNDPRELGVTVSRVAVRDAGEWRDLDLRTDGEQVLRARNPQAWVDSLVEITQRRERAVDDLFFDVRGPHSRDMREWLERHVSTYDVVLVQGVPFAPVAWVPPIARAHDVPVVLLPHYHVEDRYYHWRGYYDAFRDADDILVFPASIKASFFDRIDAPAAPIAGGGLDLAEYAPERLEAGRAEFARIHRGERPYVLVLGRKAGGKRYPLVLEAARLPGATFDVVMVGPDDDGQPVAGPNIHYYGARPREFVLGALAGCACLVNMSESESFGIVLLEAWAAGRPVIAQRRCMAFADLVVEGENGYLAGTPEEILAHANRYVAEPALADRHGAAGMRLAGRYAWEAVARDAYEIVAARVAGAPSLQPPGAARLDARPFVADAIETTARQIATGTVHDRDFEAFRRFAGPAVTCVLDVGANRGQSVASLHAVFPQAVVHCFEANPVFYPVLDEVARILEGRCVVHRYGLGSADGAFTLHVPWAGGRPWLEESSTRRDYFDVPWVARKFQERGRLELQQVVAEIRVGDELGLTPQVIKIDVEGAEHDVIAGLSRTIARAKPVLLVENSDWHRVTGTLAALGYEPFRYEPDSGELVAFHGQTTNTFYLHPQAHAHLRAGFRQEGMSA